MEEYLVNDRIFEEKNQNVWGKEKYLKKENRREVVCPLNFPAVLRRRMKSFSNNDSGGRGGEREA